MTTVLQIRWAQNWSDVANEDQAAVTQCITEWRAIPTFQRGRETHIQLLLSVLVLSSTLLLAQRVRARYYIPER